jgi:hypothetical protein
MRCPWLCVGAPYGQLARAAVSGMIDPRTRCRWIA